MGNKHPVLNYEALGNLLRNTRAITQLSQAQFAERLGLPLAVFCRLERGQGPATLPQMVHICNALGLSMDAILARMISKEQ